MKKGQFIVTIASAALVSAGVSVGTLHYNSKPEKTITETSSNSLKPQNVTFNRLQKAQITNSVDLIEAANKSIDGVVHISNFQRPNHSSSRDPFLERFFGHQKPKEQERELVLAGIGSGVIISADGYIATNHHVIKGAEDLEVVLNNNRTYKAKLIGKDPTTDLALLKIQEEELPFIEFANSDDTKVGQWVLAVGNPFNLNSTVTAGIISAKSRNINLLRSRENLAIESFIQTDAAVNPGNSGGALVDANGQLIGINTAIASPTGAFAGYSFAVPSVIVEKVTSDLKEFGTVQRALIGVSIRDVDANLSQEKELQVEQGVYIAGVNASGAAAKGGLKTGDVIVKADGKPIENTAQLQEYLGRFRPGDEVSVTFLRDNISKDTQLVLRNKIGNTDIVKKEDRALIDVYGAEMQQLTNEEIQKMRIQNGVRVVKVGKGKFAGSGMVDGFIITKIERRRVNSPSDIQAILGNHAGGGVMVEGLYPDGTQAYFAFGW
jgi:Do/DeqQ family serine protease